VNDTHAAVSATIEHVCPRCKGELSDLVCRRCGSKYSQRSGIPDFVPRGADSAQAEEISSVYDQIYTDHARVWEDQGREVAFRSYFGALAQSMSSGKLLEVGCGEGILLEALTASEKHAIDVSTTALAKARARTGATCAAALAESLPFADGSFDLVVSVGVMEHFVDEDAANREIRRVLKPGGHYLALIHVAMTFGQRLSQKIREYLWPFRPLAFAKWIKKKLVKPIRQPIQHDYTLASAANCLERSGLEVRRTITLQSDPDAPLGGDHVVLYVTQRGR
jgi:ubiquinone/menaquinone biosynthesis C-methylase UbiE